MLRRPTVQTTYGSCIDVDIVFEDDDGNPHDISTDTFGVIRSSSDAFEAAIFTIIDGPNGICHMTLPAEAAAKLNVGTGNWFRVRRIMSGGCESNTPQIWVNVQ